MRRLLFPMLGLGELAAAALLVLLGVSLPGREELGQSFGAAGRVTTAGGAQIRVIRGQVEGLRTSGLGPTADRLGAATRSAAGMLRGQRVDFEEVEALRDATDQAARGIDALARSLDPEALDALGAGLGATAEVMDHSILPASAEAAEALEAASDQLGPGTRRLATLLARSPLDLQPLRDVGEGLARFEDGFGAMDAMLDPGRLTPLRQATDGAEGVVAEAARLATRAAGYSYPIIALDGLRPKIKSRPFWPAGAAVGADMRKVAAGVAGLNRELDALGTELPKVQGAIRESRKTIGLTRQALDEALERQAEAERLLRAMPEQAARLAETLPALIDDLARGLRQIGRLADLVAALRESQHALAEARDAWPQAHDALTGTAEILRSGRDQLDAVLRNRDAYEATLDEVSSLSDDLATHASEFAGRVQNVLDEEDRTLAELDRGLESVGRALPAYESTLSRCLDLGRSLAWLVAAIAALHGSALLASGLQPRRPAIAPAFPADGPGLPDLRR